jgi:hypothetical protein
MRLLKSTRVLLDSVKIVKCYLTSTTHAALILRMVRGVIKAFEAETMSRLHVILDLCSLRG